MSPRAKMSGWRRSNWQAKTKWSPKVQLSSRLAQLSSWVFIMYLCSREVQGIDGGGTERGWEFDGYGGGEMEGIASNVAGTLMDEVDEVFPPETIKEQIQHLIQVSKPYIITATAAIVLLILLFYCGRLFITIMRSLFSYFGCGTVSGGKVIKMMIAPGTRGALVIVRSVFESNPSGYFCGLQGK